jgi:hypothetical protein
MFCRRIEPPTQEAKMRIKPKFSFLLRPSRGERVRVRWVLYLDFKPLTPSLSPLSGARELFQAVV